MPFNSQVRAISVAMALLAASATVTGCDHTTVTASEPARATAIEVNVPSVIRDGDVVPLTAIVRDQYDRVMQNVPVEWTVTDPSIAHVSPNGVLTAFREGTTQLVALAGSVQQRSTLTVTLHPAAELLVPLQQLQLMAGVQQTVPATLKGLDGRILHDRPLQWVSSNTAVVRVSASGLVTAIAPGSATVTVSYGSLNRQISVSVQGVATVYRVVDLDGTPLPAVVHDELITRTDGTTFRLIERLEGGSMTFDGRYQVRLDVTVSERYELGGNTIERVVSRRTESDFGALEYNWLDGSAKLYSERVGSLTHTLRDYGGAPLLLYRIGGTFTIWWLGLRLQQ